MFKRRPLKPTRVADTPSMEVKSGLIDAPVPALNFPSYGEFQTDRKSSIGNFIIKSKKNTVALATIFGGFVGAVAGLAMSAYDLEGKAADAVGFVQCGQWVEQTGIAGQEIKISDLSNSQKSMCGVDDAIKGINTKSEYGNELPYDLSGKLIRNQATSIAESVVLPAPSEFYRVANELNRVVDNPSETRMIYVALSAITIATLSGGASVAKNSYH